MKKVEKEYKITHKVAKLICACINTALFEIIFKYGMPELGLFFMANLTYYFGTNTIAKLIEIGLKQKEKHDWI